MDEDNVFDLWKHKILARRKEDPLGKSVEALAELLDSDRDKYNLACALTEYCLSGKSSIWGTYCAYGCSYPKLFLVGARFESDLCFLDIKCFSCEKIDTISMKPEHAGFVLATSDKCLFDR